MNRIHLKQESILNLSKKFQKNSSICVGSGSYEFLCNTFSSTNNSGSVSFPRWVLAALTILPCAFVLASSQCIRACTVHMFLLCLCILSGPVKHAPMRRFPQSRRRSHTTTGAIGRFLVHHPEWRRLRIRVKDKVAEAWAKPQIAIKPLHEDWK